LIPWGMTDQSNAEWPFKVEISVAGYDVNGKYAEVETWLSEWELPHRLASWIAASGKIRASFTTERHARAFELQFGGRVISGDELDAVLAQDAEASAQFQHAVSKLQ
jgi:hypothetical protein